MKRIVTLLTLAGAVTAAVLPAAADAKHRAVSKASAECSGAAVGKLKAKPDGRRLQVEFEVDSNRNRQAWRVVLKRNGATIYRATKRTHAPSGSFAVHKLTANPAGVDKITARATGPGGQVCVATVRI
jgi:hypothetical protein